MVGQAHISGVEGEGAGAGTQDAVETSVPAALAHIRAREDRKLFSRSTSEGLKKHKAVQNCSVPLASMITKTAPPGGHSGPGNVNKRDLALALPH